MMRGDTTNVFLVARREWWVILLFVWAGAGGGDVVHYGATVVPRCLSIKTRDTTLRYQADSGLRHWSAHITISITIPTLNPLDFVADFLSFHFLRLLKPIEMSFGGAGKQSWKKLHRISLLHFGISNTSYLDNTKTCAAWITARGSDTKMTNKYFSHNLDVNCHKYFLTSCVLINQMLTQNNEKQAMHRLLFLTIRIKIGNVKPIRLVAWPRKASRGILTNKLQISPLLNHWVQNRL